MVARSEFYRALYVFIKFIAAKRLFFCFIVGEKGRGHYALNTNRAPDRAPAQIIDFITIVITLGRSIVVIW